MRESLPKRVESYLDQKLSHLVFRRPGADLYFNLRKFLGDQGISPVREKLFTQGGSDAWLVISLDMADIRNLVLELVGLGLGEDVLGIDAKIAGKAGN